LNPYLEQDLYAVEAQVKDTKYGYFKQSLRAASQCIGRPGKKQMFKRKLLFSVTFDRYPFAFTCLLPTVSKQLDFRSAEIQLNRRRPT
jgi:hypothetical protein